MQHTIEKRGKLLRYINIESLSKEEMNEYFQLWCNKAESYPYLYHIIQNKLHYHILNGPTLIFPSKERKIQIINTEKFSQISNDIFRKKDGAVEDLVDYISDKYCTVLSEYSDNLYKQYLEANMEICTLCNRLSSRIKACYDICFYHKYCLKRGPLCHFYHLVDLQNGDPLQGYLDLNMVFMSENKLWKEHPTARIGFACIFQDVNKKEGYFHVKIMKNLPKNVVCELHNIELIKDHIYRFYLPSKKDGEFVVLNYGMRRVVHQKIH